MHPISPTLSVSLLIVELNHDYIPPGLLSCLTFRSHSHPQEGLHEKQLGLQRGNFERCQQGKTDTRKDIIFIY